MLPQQFIEFVNSFASGVGTGLVIGQTPIADEFLRRVLSNMRYSFKTERGRDIGTVEIQAIVKIEDLPITQSQTSSKPKP